MPLPYAGTSPFTFPVGIAQGGTGQTTAALARAALGLAIGTDIPALSAVALLASANTFTLAQTISATTASTSSTTGALIVAGGIGVGLDSWINTVRIGLGGAQVFRNTVVGAGAMAATAGPGDFNTAMGYESLAAVTSGNRNNALGYRSLNAVVSGSDNSAFGDSAGRLATGSNSSFFGSLVGLAATSGSQNTAIGAGAFRGMTTGGSNVALGFEAGRYQADGSTALTLTGDSNIFIGKDSRGSADAQTNSITIGTTAKSWGSNSIVFGNATTTLAQVWGLGVNRGLIWGLTLSNNGADATNDLDIAIGEARNSTGLVSMVLTGALTKRLDANWAAGTNQGMRNSAAAITDTTYHIWLASKGDGSEPDIYAHTSTVAATVLTALQLETGGSTYLYLRRIGSIVRATVILPFAQTGDHFTLTTSVADVSVTTLTTSRSTYTLASVPTGIRMRVKLRIMASNAAANVMVTVVDLNETDAAPANTVAPFATFQTAVAGAAIHGFCDIFCNTSAQIGARSTAATTTLRVGTLGWIDTRGRMGAAD